MPRLARAADRSQFDGNWAVLMGVSSVWPSTRIGFGSLQGIPVLGSRLAVHAGTDRTLAFWSDTSRGTIDTNVQDLAAVGVDMEEAGRRRPALILLGALLLGLGGGLVAVVRLRPGDRRPQEA